MAELQGNRRAAIEDEPTRNGLELRPEASLRRRENVQVQDGQAQERM